MQKNKSVQQIISWWKDIILKRHFKCGQAGSSDKTGDSETKSAQYGAESPYSLIPDGEREGLFKNKSGSDSELARAPELTLNWVGLDNEVQPTALKAHFHTMLVTMEFTMLQCNEFI